MCWSQCKIQGQELIRSDSMRFSRRSTPQRMLESEWDSRFAGRSSPLMEVDCGQRPIGPGARHFSSLCPQARSVHESSSCGLSGLESRTKAAFQMLIIHGFAKVTNHSILQGAVSSRFIRIRGDENGWAHV